jgi:hypothetical protein
MSDLAPLTQTLTADVDASTAEADATVAVGTAPFAGTVTDVSYIANAKITGTKTDTRTLKLINEGAKGEGTTVVAELALVEKVNAGALAVTELTLGEAKKLVVVEGDVLAWTSTHVLKGLVDPGGEVRVTLDRS